MRGHFLVCQPDKEVAKHGIRKHGYARTNSNGLESLYEANKGKSVSIRFKAIANQVWECTKKEAAKQKSEIKREINILRTRFLKLLLRRPDGLRCPAGALPTEPLQHGRIHAQLLAFSVFFSPRHFLFFPLSCSVPASALCREPRCNLRVDGVAGQVQLGLDWLKPTALSARAQILAAKKKKKKRKTPSVFLLHYECSDRQRNCDLDNVTTKNQQMSRGKRVRLAPSPASVAANSLAFCAFCAFCICFSRCSFLFEKPFFFTASFYLSPFFSSVSHLSDLCLCRFLTSHFLSRTNTVLRPNRAPLSG